MSYPAISLATATVGRHRCPQKRLQTARQPPVYPNSSPDHRACNSLTPFRCPHAVHPCPSVDSGLVAALVIVAVLVLPAILRLVGRHINRLSISFIAGSRTSADAGAGARWSRMLRRSPLLFLILSLALLLTLASPILSMRLGSADAGSNPESSTTRRAYDLLSQGFGPGFNGPILVALEIDDPNAKSLVETLPGQIDQIEGVAFSSPPLLNEAEDAAIISIIPQTSPQDEKTGELVDRLRRFLPQETAGSGARAFVGGQTAAFIDIAQKLSDGMPVFFVAVIGVSVLLLAMVFRSIVVPLKAALMILLSVGVGFRGRDSLIPVGLAERDNRSRHHRPGRIVSPDDALRGPVRTLDGLLGLPRDSGARGVSRHRRRRGRCRTRPGRNFSSDHCRRSDHELRLLQLRLGRCPGHKGIRLRVGHRNPRGRSDRPHGLGAIDHAPCWQQCLVVPKLARPLLPNISVESPKWSRRSPEGPTIEPGAYTLKRSE